MIIVQLAGGLGNQMFQYAAGRSLASARKVEMRYDATGWFKSGNAKPTLREYSLDCFNITSPQASPLRIASFKVMARYGGWMFDMLGEVGRHHRPIVYHEPHLHFDDAFFELSTNAYVVGYWLSEKYFRMISDDIRREFSWKVPQTGRNREIAHLIRSTVSVGLHVRRGDFVSDAETNKIIGTCSLDYYHKSVAEIGNRFRNPHFFIFSDDIKWVKDNVEIDFPVVYVENNFSAPFEDMRLMSQCKHNIIANSSFSWWAAWLNTNPEKVVLAPGVWFNERAISTIDLIPDNWTIVE
jgi:hypothetical protein